MLTQLEWTLPSCKPHLSHLKNGNDGAHVLLAPLLALQCIVAGKLSVIKLVIDMVSRISMVISISGTDGRIIWREWYSERARVIFHENRRKVSPHSLKPPAFLMDMSDFLAFWAILKKLTCPSRQGDTHVQDSRLFTESPIKVSSLQAEFFLKKKIVP